MNNQGNTSKYSPLSVALDNKLRSEIEIVISVLLLECS